MAAIHDYNIVTQAKSREELLKNIQEALDLYYEDGSQQGSIVDVRTKFYFSYTPTLHATELSANT